VRKIELLRELQDVDSALDQDWERLRQLRARLGDESELVPYRETLETARRQLRSLRTKGLDLDLKLEKEASKRKADEKKLYDGSIKNSKELSSLAQDVEAQRQRISKLEDQSLMNMDAMEGAAAALQDAERALADKEAAWKAEQSALEVECEALTAGVGTLSADRARVVSQLDAPALRSYESLRRLRGGLAVVAVEQRACRGCRISLSSSEVQRARSSQEPVTCQSCGRMLYVP